MYFIVFWQGVKNLGTGIVMLWIFLRATSEFKSANDDLHGNFIEYNRITCKITDYGNFFQFRKPAFITQ